MQSVVTLARRGATEGERNASKAAMTRMLDRATVEAASMPADVAERFLARINAIAKSVDDPEPQSPFGTAPPPEPPKATYFEVGNWIVNLESGKVGKIDSIESPHTVMAVYTVKYIDGSTIRSRGKNIRKATVREVNDALMAHKKANQTGDDTSDTSSKKSSDDKWVIYKLSHVKGKTTSGHKAFRNGNIFGIGTYGSEFYTFFGKVDGPFTIRDYTQEPTNYTPSQAKRRCYTMFNHRVANNGFIIVNDPEFLAATLTILQKIKP
jgi:hypothetical protein